MNGRLAVWIDRLHQVDLDFGRTLTDGADILVDVLAFGDERARDFEAQHVDPESFESRRVWTADCDLLDAEYPEWSCTHVCSSLDD